MNKNGLEIIFQGMSYGYNDYISFKKKYEQFDSNQTVAIFMHRSPRLIFAMLMLMERNCTFILIDPLYPNERIKYILENSKCDAVFTDGGIEIRENNSCEGNIDLAYLIYTSGSTGKPKGVEIRRESLINFIDGIAEVIDFSPTKRITCLTTVSFDIFLLESLMAIYKGLTVILATEDEQRNPKLMANLIKNNNTDMIQITPSRMQLLLNHDKELSCLVNIKEIMIGGESFPLSLLQILQEKTTAKIYNMYGPTETTIWSTVSDLTNKNRIDIGHPIKNTKIYIVDEDLSILTNQETGEICIAGKGLANGYIGLKALTNEKFINLPQMPDVKVYRTGDVGRWLPDGNIEYLGRLDNQVKIRGYRIELEEIESYINQCDGIMQSVVITLETSETDKILEAFYTSEKNILSKDIENYLSQKLPNYMIPTIFKRVENFIQTANGKIDRKRVLECKEVETNIVISESPASNLSDIQKRALEVFVSNVDEKISGKITIASDFSSIGLDSITFIKVVVALEGEFDFEFDDEMLLITAFPTVGSMIEYVESKSTVK
jgi:amino acid adenylation domain-containing protein